METQRDDGSHAHVRKPVHLLTSYFGADAYLA